MAGMDDMALAGTSGSLDLDGQESDDSVEIEDRMCRRWTIEDDRQLISLQQQGKSNQEIAIALQRGTQGVVARARKLSNIDSTAYARLVGNEEKSGGEGLRPFKDVLGRILFDSSLDLTEFSFVYSDRFDGDVERGAAEGNDNVKGKERRLIKAIPEHRIKRLLHRGRVVWCKETRTDLIFGGTDGMKLDEVILTSDEWLAEQEGLKQAASQTQIILYCDLDGVLADFDQGCVRLFGKKPDEVPKKNMWTGIARQTENGGFFDSLPWMPNGKLLWESIAPFQPTILTGTPQGKWAKPQKERWCARELGEQVQVITCMSNEKYKWASRTSESADIKASTCILIDDRETAREPWVNAGGVFIHYHEDRLEDVLRELQAHLPQLRLATRNEALLYQDDESAFALS